MTLHEFEITGEGGEAETGGVETGGEEAGGEEAGGEEAGGEAETGGVETGGVETGGEEAGGEAETGGVETGGVETGGVETGGVEAGGEAEAGGEDGGPGDPIKLGFDLKGNSFIKAPNGDVPLSGGIDVNFDLESGKYDAELNLEPSTGKFKIMGFLDVVSDVEFVQTAPTSGTFDGTKLESHSEMDVYLKTVNAFGFPIGGGENCKTVEPAKIDLTSDKFDPFKGGKLTGEYELPPLQECGMLSDMISMFAAGPGNTIDMKLTAKK